MTPFSIGSRNRLGRFMALLKICLVIARAIGLHEFRKADGEVGRAGEGSPTAPMGRRRRLREILSVNEGKAPVSNTSLFKYPTEIVGQILESLPWSSLASFALVFRDFRQLARSRQFSSINLDYSDKSLALIKKLVAEVTIREGSYGTPSSISQSLGVCIRRITVATNPGWVAARHNIALSDEFLALKERTRAKRLTSASKHFFDYYIRKIQFLLSSRTALPHLELLNWQDKITLPRSFFEHLPFTSIQHLRLFRVNVNKAFEIRLPKTLESWPLRTLYLEVNPSLSRCLKKDGPSTHLICASILRLCASTLEFLTWETTSRGERFSFATYTNGTLPRFPRLRNLGLSFVTFADYSMLDAMLEVNLRELEVNLAQDPLYSEFFEERGTMPELTTLVWNGYIKADQSLTFLQENTQLSKISLQSQAPNAFLEDQLLPLLTKSFQHLISLSLKWEDDSIPASALDAISSLESLQQLHLSAGEDLGWRHSWLIDHELVRIRLKNLSSLKRMAFSRDTYDNGFEWSDPDSYYVDRIHDISRFGPLVRDWETWHRERMLTEAKKYATEMPNLEWLYIGQLCMRVSSEAELQDGRPKVFALSEERDDCWTYLRQMFRWKTT